MKSRTQWIFCKPLLLGALVLCSGTTLALDMKPGKWGTTSTVETPMAPEPVVEYSEECVEEGFDPVQDILDEGMGGQCDVTLNEDSSTVVDADMACEIPGAGPMTGNLHFTVNGDNASGSMLMSMNMGGQTMDTTVEFEAEYLGACD